MNRTRSYSAETPHRENAAVPRAMPASASASDANRLGIRILGLKTISLEKGARLTAFLECASELKRMPDNLLPFLAEELVDASATLPSEQGLRALKAVFAFAGCNKQ